MTGWLSAKNTKSTNRPTDSPFGPDVPVKTSVPIVRESPVAKLNPITFSVARLVS